MKLKTVVEKLEDIEEELRRLEQTATSDSLRLRRCVANVESIRKTIDEAANTMRELLDCLE